MLERDCQVGIGQKQGSRVKDCAACENAPVYMLVRFCPTVEHCTDQWCGGTSPSQAVDLSTLATPPLGTSCYLGPNLLLVLPPE